MHRFIRLCVQAPGASIPLEAMMHFPPVSDFPLFSTNFQTLWKIFKILPFPEKFFDFHPPKFLMTFFRISPYFPCFSTFPPVSRKLLFRPPTMKNFPPVFEKFTCFLHILCVFRFPPTLTMMHLCITQCTYWTSLTGAIGSVLCSAGGITSNEVVRRPTYL